MCVQGPGITPVIILLTLAAVAFHFCRVGDDDGAMTLLTHLDNCDEIGQYVDCLPGVYIYPWKYCSFGLLHH